MENSDEEDHDKEDYETEDNVAEAPNCFGGDHTASFNAFEKLMRCDSLTDFPEIALEDCTIIEMK